MNEYLPSQYGLAPVEQPTMPSAVELATDRRVVWVPDAYGRMVPMPREMAPPMPVATPPRDLSSVPLIDPIAARMAGGGVLGAGVGYGIGQIVSALAGLGGAALLGLAVALVAMRMARPTGGQGAGGTEVHIHRGAKVRVRNLHHHGG